MLESVSNVAAHALLRQLQASLEVNMGELQYHDDEHRRLLWMITATSQSGERWTAKAEEHYDAACALATLMGFELADG
jgi:hypothetical protein